MKKLKMICVFLILTLLFTGCTFTENKQTAAKPLVPKETTIRSILELSTIECYYNNVAKFHQDDASGYWLWKKDKDFWIEYSGIVKFGIDISKVLFEIQGNTINISIPNAEVLWCKIDEESLTQDSYVLANGSATVSSKDEIFALSEAQSNMEKIASNDSVLLETARQRARILIEDYIHNITKLDDIEYQINWIYLD